MSKESIIFTIGHSNHSIERFADLLRQHGVTAVKDVRSVGTRQDKVQMSEEARLLAKARAALGNIEETNTEKLAALRGQIESGDYTVQLNELARKLATKLYPK